jgi:hypothetical protein
MKKMFYSIVIVFVALSKVGCSEEPPSIRVSNERAKKSNVQIKTVNNTINQNDIAGGTVTNYQDVPEGRVFVTADKQYVIQLYCWKSL